MVNESLIGWGIIIFVGVIAGILIALILNRIVNGRARRKLEKEAIKLQKEMQPVAKPVERRLPIIEDAHKEENTEEKIIELRRRIAEAERDLEKDRSSGSTSDSDHKLLEQRESSNKRETIQGRDDGLQEKSIRRNKQSRRRSGWKRI